MGAGEWVAVAAALVAVVAVGFAAVQAQAAKVQAQAAKEQVAQARRQTEIQERVYQDQQQPYVWVDYRLDPVSYTLIDLVIKNEGPTIARNVKITINPMIKRTAEFHKAADLPDLQGFVDGFASIPPGREMRWSLGYHTEIAVQGNLGRHDVTISFDGPFGPVEPYTFVLDYADMKAASLRDPGHIGQVAKELKEIKKHVEKGVQVVRAMDRGSE